METVGSAKIGWTQKERALAIRVVASTTFGGIPLPTDDNFDGFGFRWVTAKLAKAYETRSPAKTPEQAARHATLKRALDKARKAGR